MGITDEERLRQLEEKLHYLKRNVPDWRLYDGSDPNHPARQIWRLEEQRKRIVVRLSRRGPLGAAHGTHEGRGTEGPKETGSRESPPEPFNHSPDYRSVTLRGKAFSLTPRQAQVIQILHEAHENGNPEVGNATILEQLGTTNSRLRDTFRSNPEARKALVRAGRTKGSYQLNL